MTEMDKLIKMLDEGKIEYRILSNDSGMRVLKVLDCIDVRPYYEENIDTGYLMLVSLKMPYRCPVYNISGYKALKEIKNIIRSFDHE